MSAVRITISTRARAKSPNRCTRSTIANRQLKIENEIWARLDSNQGPRDYESPALPLSYRPVSILGIRTQSTARDQRDIWANFWAGHTTINFQYFNSVKNYFTSRQAMFRRQSGQVWRSRDGRRVRSKLRWIKIPTGITCRLSSLSKHSKNG